MKLNYLYLKCKLILFFTRLKMRLHLAFVTLFYLPTKDVDFFITSNFMKNYYKR